VDLVLRRIIGPKKRKEQEAGGNYIEQLHNLYVPQNITRVTSSRNLRLAGSVEHVEEMRNAYKISFR
jgi:hypothetical protein